MQANAILMASASFFASIFVPESQTSGRRLAAAGVPDSCQQEAGCRGGGRRGRGPGGGDICRAATGTAARQRRLIRRGSVGGAIGIATNCKRHGVVISHEFVLQICLIDEILGEVGVRVHI